MTYDIFLYFIAAHFENKSIVMKDWVNFSSEWWSCNSAEVLIKTCWQNMTSF